MKGTQIINGKLLTFFSKFNMCGHVKQCMLNLLDCALPAR
jgi:hypothetical protein